MLCRKGSKMDEVCKELDELKTEFEKFREQYRIKSEISESLRRSYDEQLAKNEEAKLQFEKQARELNAKSEEIAELSQLYEQAKSQLHETEANLKKVNSLNDKIRIDSVEKVERLEGDNRKLVSALEEATGRNDVLEQKLQISSEEIAGLKCSLSKLQRKCSEAEEKVRVGKELRHREDVIMKLEEQSMTVQDQLKWKKEQFQHLEEAHKQIQDQFQLSKKEWASEKSTLLEEMTKLQSDLNSQIRITDSLESRLKMCNQALAYEESKRKLLEVQLSESKQCFDNVLAEYEEAKTKIESLSSKRDEDVAGLRVSLGIKEQHMKEMEYRLAHFEHEKKELLATVKELQEAQINKRKVDPSVTKIRNKLKDLEQAHSLCAPTLKKREAGWSLKMEKLIGDMEHYKSVLERESEQVQQLKMQLDSCHSEMEVSGEETSILLLVMKSELSDAYSKLFEPEAEIEALSKKGGGKIATSAEGLEMEDRSQLEAQICLEQAREKIAELTKKIDSLMLLEERSSMLEDALEKHKLMLEESSKCQLHLKEEVSQLEVALQNMSTALENSNYELTAKMNEIHKAETELKLWKSKAESFRTCLEQSQEVCQKMETSILEQLETEKGLMKEKENFQCRLIEQEQIIDDLQQKIASLDQIVEQKEAVTEAIKMEVAKAYKKEEHFLQLLKERDAIVEALGQEVKAMEEQSVLRASAAAEFAKVEAVNEFEYEKEKLCNIIRERDAAVENLSKELQAMEEQSVKRESTAADSAKVEAASKFEHEKEKLCNIIKERDTAVEHLKKELQAMEEQSGRRVNAAAESAVLEAKSKFQCQKEQLCRIMATEKERMMMRVEDVYSSAEQNFSDVSLFSLSQDAEYLVKISALQEALEKADCNMKAEFERKNNEIDLLEMEVKNLHNKILVQEDSLLNSEQSVKELKALIEAKKLEMEKIVCQLREEQTKLSAQLQDLELEKQAAIDNVNRLTSERINLLTYMDELCEGVGNFCVRDVELEGMLGKMLLDRDNNDRLTSDVVMSDSVCDPVLKHVRKEAELCRDRSPLKEINSSIVAGNFI